MQGSGKTGTAAAVFIFFLITLSEAFTLSGTCIDYITDDPIDTCRMLLEAFSPDAVGDSVFTDKGDYTFSNVPAGVYKVIAADQRFAPDTVWLTVDRDTALSFILFDLDHLLDSIPDTLYRERSPYLVRKSVGSYNPLTILPGVHIKLIEKGRISFDERVSALGEPEDSIVFINSCTAPQSMGHILSYARNDTCHFRYCSFRGLETIRPYGYRVLQIENCRFTGMKTAITFDYFDICHWVYLTGNIITDCKNGLTGLKTSPVPESWAISVTCRENLVFCTDTAFRLTSDQELFLEHNTIIGQSDIKIGQNDGTDTIRNTVFTDIILRTPSNTGLFFSCNAIESILGGLPPGIGSPVTLNQNGDSCDYFYNLFVDPRIADSTTGQLYEGSVCIVAASDGTDIGVYQGEHSSTKENHSSLHVSSREHSVQLRIGRWTVLVPAGTLSETCIIELYSLQGKRLFRSEQTGGSINRTGVAGGTLYVPFTNAAGCYLLRITGKGHHFFTKSLLSVR